MTNTTTTPPDGRPHGPVHGWFELSYSNYLVLPRTLMQSMPEEWQARMVACLEEILVAFQHLEYPDAYEVTAAEERYYDELSEAEMAERGVTREETPDDTLAAGPGLPVYIYYDKRGDQHYSYDRLLVPLPGGDPIPHYNRGRTYIEPRVAEEVPA